MSETSLAVESGPPVEKALWAARLAWSLGLISILAATFALGISIQRAVTSGATSALLTHQTLNPLITAGFAVLGALVTSRHPRNPIGWIFVTTGLLSSLISLCAAVIISTPASSPLRLWAEWFGAWIWIPASILPWTFVLLVFPDGRLPSPRWRLAAWPAALGLAGTVISIMFHPDPSVDWGARTNPLGVSGFGPFLDALLNASGVLLGIGVLGSLAAVFVRYRRSQAAQRAQMKWLVYGVAISVLGLVLSSIAWSFMPGVPWMEEANIVITNLGLLSIAAAAAVAILRYRLYDINLVINRTLVYAALTAGVIALYAVVVGSLGALFQARSSFLVSLLATGLAALLVQPMRDRLQRLVNRLMYGERDDPYAVLAGLSRRLEGSLSPEATLPAVVETVAQALKLPYVAIALKQEDGFVIAASYGSARKALLELPLVYQGETVGQLRLSWRSATEPFPPGEQRLLLDIARHIGVTAHTVLLTQDLRRLADDLQRSREELVKSREEERRRLRRDLHDELGPQLASLKLNLDVARNLVSRDPRAAEALLVELRAQSQASIADIRRLVYDLRPPALDELGLFGAVQEYTRQIASQDGLHLRFDCPTPLPRLPAAVEVAAYRITLEALANVVRHSQAKNSSVTLSVMDQHLRVEVCDDGQGIPPGTRPGVGLGSMRERAAELGGTCLIEPLPRGGTRVLAVLPLG